MPWLSSVVIASLAVAVGINTVVFSWIQARILRPLPGVPGAGRYLLIEPRTDAGLYPGTSWLEYRELAALDSFDGMIAYRSQPLYVGASTEVERVPGQLVSENYFTSLGIRPVAGRMFEAEDAGTAGSEPVAVVSYGLWQSRLGGAQSLAGQTLRINGREVSIVGVAPEGFQGTTLGLYFDIWLPASSAPLIVSGSRELTDRSVRGYQVLTRLRAGVTQAQAQSQLSAAMTQLAGSYPMTNGGVSAHVLTPGQAPRGPQRMATALYVLQGVMALLLVAVCGNVSNLMLARASARRREMGVRLALGAAPWRIGSLICCESVLLATAGAALGAALAVWGTKALLVVPITGLPIRFQTQVDAIGLAVAIGLGIFSGLLAAAAPAFHLSRIDPQRALRVGAREAARSRVRDGLMAAQAGFALVVLIVAGLFVQSYLETRAADTGFKTQGVLLAGYDLRGRAATPDRMRTFADEVLSRLRREPAFGQAAIASSVPLDIHGLPLRMFSVEGRARDDGNLDQAATNTVTPGYFEVMEIPFRRGRDFAALADAAAPPQAIVNEAFADRYLAGLEPIGRRVVARGRRFTIAGVVANSLSNAFGEPATPVLYLSFRDNPQPFGDIHLRVRAGSPTTATPDVRRVVGSVDPELPLFNVRTLEAHVDSNLVFRRVPARMFAVLGPLLLALAAIGIYASVAYTATLRTQEIGIRLALGASPRRLIARFMAQHLTTIGIGLGLGWVCAAATVWQRATAVSAPEVVFVLVPAALLMVAAASCWVPAYRASRTSPRLTMQGT